MSDPTRALAPSLAGVGWKCAGAMVGLTVMWLASLLLVPGPPADGDELARLQYLERHPEAFAGATFVVGLALLHVPVWLGLAAVMWERRPVAGVLGVAFGLIYAPLAILAYWSQLTVVRGLAELALTDPASAVTAYRLFEFPGGLASFAYGIDVLAYAVWGVAALAVATGLAGSPDRLARTTGVLFAVSGGFAIVGAAGFVLGNAFLELGVLLSGVGFLAGLVAAVPLLRRHAAGAAAGASVSFEVRFDPGKP